MGFFLMSAVYYARLSPRLLGRLASTQRVLVHWRTLARDRALVHAIMTEVEHQSGALPPDAWRVQRALWTEADVTVVYTGRRGQPPALVLRLAHTPAGEASLRRQRAALHDLRANPVLGGLQERLAEPLAAGRVAGQLYTVERGLPGRDMREVLLGPPASSRVPIARALSTIAQLHRSTARSTVVDAGMLDRWIHAPLRQLAPLAHEDGGIRRLAAELDAALAGREVRIGWIHGDFWPGNVLVAHDGASVSGIVDWDLASPDELPMHDLLHFKLSTECLLSGREIGDVVRKRLNEQRRTDQERDLLTDLAQLSFGEGTLVRAMVLLYWLRFVTTYLANNPRRFGHRWWVARNVQGVLGAL
ncbi:MAG: aminoglycoside phosphotransferase family protein [Dehalococcoidia bacterium]|nr:aminoglycoside phosphotransferase family protein [Dehalococcoidia bacterium]